MDDVLHFAMQLLKDRSIPVVILKSPEDLKLNDLDLGLRNMLYQNKKDVQDTLPVLDPDFVTKKNAYDICDCFGINYIVMPLNEDAQILFAGPFLYETDYMQTDVRHICQQLKLNRVLTLWFLQYYNVLPRFASANDMHSLIANLQKHLYGEAKIENLNYSLPHPRPYRDDPDNLYNEKKINAQYAFENHLIDLVRHGNEQAAIDLINPDMIHTFIYENRSSNKLRNYKNYCIILNTLFRKTVEETGVPPVFIDAISRHFALSIEDCQRASELKQICIRMVRDYCQLVSNNATSGYSPIVAKAIDYIHIHLSQNLSLQAIACELNVSKAYLSARFHHETGVPLTSYVISCRMDEAMRLLETGRKPIQDIALACGYSNLAYFSKTFRKEKHFSPSAYRYFAGTGQKE